MTRSLKPPEWEQYPLRTAELCAGYGGLSLSVGDKHPSWVSEVDPHASRVLRDRFPYSPNLGDMTRIDWSSAPGVDVAGARTSRGGNGMPALGRVVTDLAGLGYGVVWDSVRASDVGAPHRRERVFVLAFRPTAADTLRVLLDRTREARNGRLEPSNPDSPSRDPRLGDYGERMRLWESVTGMPMPEPEEDSPRGGRRLSARFGEWMMGLPPGWVTGLRTIPRTAQIKILGNGVVPLQGRLAVHTLASRALEALS